MSIEPGDLKLKDPDSEKNAQFDWSGDLDAGVSIVAQAVTVSGPDSALVADNVSLAVGAQKVNYRLTGGTLGRKYTVTCRITTDELPEGRDDRSYRVLIQQR